MEGSLKQHIRWKAESHYEDERIFMMRPVALE